MNSEAQGGSLLPGECRVGIVSCSAHMSSPSAQHLHHPGARSWQAINRTSEVIECQQAKVDLDRILGLQSFDLEKILGMDPEFLAVRAPAGAPSSSTPCTACTARWLYQPGAAEQLQGGLLTWNGALHNICNA